MSAERFEVGDDMSPIDCVAVVLVKGHRVLAEKRTQTKSVAPGAVALPGGHVERGERPEDALRREVWEELRIVPRRIAYVCTLLHRAQEFCALHYFAVEEWEGELSNREAEALTWVSLGELSRLDLDVDRMAVVEYLRVYRDAEASMPAGHQGEMEEAEETVGGEERARDGQQ